MKKFKPAMVGVVAILAFGIATLPRIAAAASFVTRNSLEVVGDPSANGRFEVKQRAGKGGSDYWCAAGEYVIQGLRMSPGTRVYLEQPMGASKMGLGKSIGYTVRPSAELTAIVEGQSRPLNLSMKRVGDNWSAEHGRSQCPTNRRRDR